MGEARGNLGKIAGAASRVTHLAVAPYSCGGPVFIHAPLMGYARWTAVNFWRACRASPILRVAWDLSGDDGFAAGGASGAAAVGVVCDVALGAVDVAQRVQRLLGVAQVDVDQRAIAHIDFIG